MRFKRDVEATAGLEGAYRPGLQALPRHDANRLDVARSISLTGSVHLDDCLREQFPSDPRWDYVIGTRKKACELLHWIEVHDAGRTGSVREIGSKLQWLTGWLNTEGHRLHGYDRRFVWVAAGRSAFHQNSPEIKKLALQGLHFAGRHYELE